MKTRILLTLALVALLLGAAFFSLPPQTEARPALGRTSVEGVWGLAPINYTSTGAQTLTPTNSLYLLAPTAALTLTLATGQALPGDIVGFVNTVATNTNVVDTGATGTGSARDLGEKDINFYMYADGAWVEIYFSNNQ